MIVDIHAHYFPKTYNDTLLRIGGRSLPEAARAITARPIRHDDAAQIAVRLEQMDDAGVQTVIERMIKQGRDSLAQFREGCSRRCGRWRTSSRS